MLVLTRRVGETITIGSNITVTILKMDGPQIRIGIDAPKGIDIHRDGLCRRPRQYEAAGWKK